VLPPDLQEGAYGHRDQVSFCGDFAWSIVDGANGHCCFHALRPPHSKPINLLPLKRAASSRPPPTTATAPRRRTPPVDHCGEVPRVGNGSLTGSEHHRSRPLWGTLVRRKRPSPVLSLSLPVTVFLCRHEMGGTARRTRRLEMILDILTIVFLVHCANMISRLMARRHDVLYYVSRSDDPHR
jgi:hypothetical protein